MTRRNEFSAATKRAAHARSGGICECHMIRHVFPVACGRPVGPGNLFYEHIDPDAISGRNDLDNCAVLTKTCWRRKTDHYDKPTVAKSNRVRDRYIGAKNPSRRPMPGGRNSPYKIKVGGGVELRYPDRRSS